MHQNRKNPHRNARERGFIQNIDFATENIRYMIPTKYIENHKMPVYIAKIYHDDRVQELIVKAPNLRLAKKFAQPRVVVSKLAPDQIFEYVKSGSVLPGSDQNNDANTMSLFPVDFSLIAPKTPIESE